MQVKKIQTDPVASVYFQFLRSEIDRYQEEPQMSLDAIERAIGLDPKVGYFYYQRALINAGSNLWEGVIADCQEALRLDPGIIDAKVLLGKAFGVLNRHSESIRYLKEVGREEPGREDVYQLLAKEYMNIEEYGQAEAVMRELLARDSEAMVAYYYLGAIYGAYMKQPERAIAVYQKILEREPENAQVIDTISQLYLETGKTQKALEMLLEMERFRTNDVSLKLKIAQIYYKMKEYPPAIERFEWILKQSPGSDKIMYYLGVLYEESGNFPGAIEMYQGVPPASGLYKDARLRLAYRYRSMEKNDQAKEVLIEAIRRQPKIADFYQYLGGIYEREGDLKGSIRLLTKATKAFPDNSGLYFALGTLYEKAKDYKKAIAAMRRVLELDPKNASALNYIGYTIVEQGGDLDEAEDMLQEAVNLKPDDGYIVDSLGWLYFKKGDLTKAFLLLKRADKLVPDEPTVLKHLGHLYLRRGETETALTYFRKALQAWQKKEQVDEKEIEELIQLIQGAMRDQ